MEHKMTNTNDTNMMNKMNELQEQEKEQKNFLRQLLYKFSNKRGFFFAQKVKMGIQEDEGTNDKHVNSYIAKHTLRHVAKNIFMGSDMPFMSNFRDARTGKILITDENFDDLKQRAPDWSRQVGLTSYLLINANHKFSTILAVVQPDWVNDENSENWENGIAMKDAINFESLDEEGNIGLLNLDTATIYALDGQHRIMGIKGLTDLEANKFEQRNKTASKIIDTFSKEDFFDRINLLDHSRLEKVLNEDISVEYLPAVLKGETIEQARRRIRSIFVSLNTNAKKPTKGELYLLEEEEGYVIVSNKIARNHPMYRNTNRINMTDTTLNATSNYWATLESIAQASKNLLILTNEKREKKWEPPFKNIAGSRPSTDDLTEAHSELSKFYDLMSKMSIFQLLERSDDKKAVRSLKEFPKLKLDKDNLHNIDWKEIESMDFKGHLLLKPIGPQILAYAVGKLVNEDGALMEEVFESIYKMDKDSMFSAHLPKSIFYGITFNPLKQNMDTNKQAIASELIRYLVKGGDKDYMQDLMDQIISGRTIDPINGTWINFDGKIVQNVEGSDETSFQKLPRPYKMK